MNIKAVLAAFEQWRAESSPMALVTVVQTHGSTYAKAGAHMILGPGNAYVGLVSGGCLEGDLMDRARPVLEKGASLTVFYDMRDEEEDLLWGMGVGCSGATRLLLQPLNSSNGFQPLAGLARAITGRRPTTWAAVTDSAIADAPVGAWVLVGDDAELQNGLAPAALPALRDLCVSHDGPPGIEPVDIAGQDISAYVARVPFSPRVLLLGSGPDVIPVMRMMENLGWEVSIRDHRPAYIDRITAAGATDAQLARPEESMGKLPECEAAMVMSHHLKTDEGWLGCLADMPASFIGLLGPIARRERLLEAVGSDADKLRHRVHGPVGLDLGGRAPEDIALAIVAQIQAALAGRDGGFIHTP